MELQIPHPPPPLPNRSICSTSLATHKYTIPQKPQKQSIPVKWETIHHKRKQPTKPKTTTRKLKTRIKNGSKQEQQEQSRKQSSAIFLIRVLQKGLGFRVLTWVIYMWALSDPAPRIWRFKLVDSTCVIGSKNLWQLDLLHAIQSRIFLRFWIQEYMA